MLEALFAAFAGGIILNLMPCVFPVLSLKVAGLVKNAGNPGQRRAEAMAFLLGVIATQIGLAGTLLALRTGGSAVGWGFQLQSPVMTGTLGLVMLGIALNLSGQFEIGLGSHRIGRAGERLDGITGAALTGSLAILVATPCTAPVMAGALAYALVQPAMVGLAVFAMLGLGFAAPFTILVWSPTAARLLPAPGRWMASLRTLLSFPMFAASAWMVWVVANQTGVSGLAHILAALLALAFAGLMFGWGQQRRMASRTFVSLYAIAIAATAGALAEVASLEPSASLPESSQRAPGPVAVTTMAWSQEKVAALRGAGRPVFVNFTATWCITCQVNERTTLSTTAVQNALARTGTVYLIADSTKFDLRIQKALDGFGRAGLPLYVYYPSGRRTPMILPQLLTPAIVERALAISPDSVVGS